MKFNSINRSRICTFGVAIASANFLLNSACCADGTLASESIGLLTGPGITQDAGNLDMVVQTGPGAFATWGEKGATGLQGAASVFPSGSSYVNLPPSIVAMKFQIASVVSSLNSTYGAGNWTISNPTITMQYTYYANNSVFGGGAGNFDTYVIQNNNWAFNGGAGSAGLFSTYVAGIDPQYLPTSAALAAWSNGQAYLGNTTYNWLSPTVEPPGQAAPINPNYSSWSTDKSGLNQGILTDALADDPLLVSDIVSGASNNNLSFYFIPNNSVGLTIFTGGGTSEPTLNFNVVAVPEPASLALMIAGFALLLAHRSRRSATASELK